MCIKSDMGFTQLSSKESARRAGDPGGEVSVPASGDPLEEGMAAHSSIRPGESRGQEPGRLGLHGHRESDSRARATEHLQIRTRATEHLQTSVLVAPYKSPWTESYVRHVIESERLARVR